MTESRALGAGLLVSLLINAFFIGVLVTRWAQGERPGAYPEGPPPSLNLGRLATGLPPDLRPQVDAAFREQRAAMREHMAALVAQRRRVRAVLTADDFDADVLSRELAQLRKLDGAVAARAHEALVALAGRLDASGRRRLADTMGRRPPPGAMRPGRMGPGGLRPPPEPPPPTAAP